MNRTRPALRLFRTLVLVLQLALWGAVPIADALTHAEHGSTAVLIEAQTRAAAPGNDHICPFCNFLQLRAPVAHDGTPTPVSSETLRESPASRHEIRTTAARSTTLPRAPPSLA